MKHYFLFLLVTLFSGSALFSQTFKLPELPYAYSALEPYIDAQTMEIHHSRHHQAYVKNLNTALGTEVIGLDELMLNISKRSDAIRNNGGGHYNHSLFWEILGPSQNKQPSGALKLAIEKEFGSLDSLKKVLSQAASTRFGSGWAWLIVTPDKKLKVISTPNQDNPLMDVVKDRGIPVLGIDVWEHAYYLKYQNKRGDYLNAIWSVLNWGSVSEKYDQALQSPVLKKIARDSWGALNDFSSSLSQVKAKLKTGNSSEAKQELGNLSGKGKTLSFSGIPSVLNKDTLQQKLNELNQKCDDLNTKAQKKISDLEINNRIGEIENKLNEVLKDIQ